MISSVAVPGSAGRRVSTEKTSSRELCRSEEEHRSVMVRLSCPAAAKLAVLDGVVNAIKGSEGEPQVVVWREPSKAWLGWVDRGAHCNERPRESSFR